MKRRIIASLLLAIVICCLAVYSFATTEIITKKVDSFKILSTENKEEIIAINVADSIVDMQESEKNGTTDNNEQNTEETGKIVINKGEKIYTNPLENVNSIKVVENEEAVKIVTVMNGWSYVKSDSIEGWIRTESLTDTSKEAVKKYINNGTAKLKKTADSNGEVISGLTLNKVVEIIATYNGWTKVKVNGNIGYVESKYISDTATRVTTRSSTYRRERTPMATVSGEKPSTSDVVAFAKQFVGYRYVMGGASPSGFDCSGFTQYIYKQFGYSISRIPRDQAYDGIAVNKADLKPGDIICFSNARGSSSIGHVGLYIGGGKVVHAANSRRGVIISNVDGDGFYYVCASRIIY